MAMQIDCYLSFHGNCEEALNFYARCLGGKVGTLMRFEGAPMQGVPAINAEETERLIYSVLTEAQRARFEEHWELDGSVSIPGDTC